MVVDGVWGKRGTKPESVTDRVSLVRVLHVTTVDKMKAPKSPKSKPWYQTTTTMQTTITPHNQQPYVTRQYPSKEQVDISIAKAKAAQKAWSQVPLSERIEIGRKFMVRYYALRYFTLIQEI